MNGKQERSRASSGCAATYTHVSVCGVWSVECGVWSVECGVWSVECGVWSVPCVPCVLFACLLLMFACCCCWQPGVGYQYEVLTPAAGIGVGRQHADHNVSFSNSTLPKVVKLHLSSPTKVMQKANTYALQHIHAHRPIARVVTRRCHCICAAVSTLVAGSACCTGQSRS